MISPVISRSPSPTGIGLRHLAAERARMASDASTVGGLSSTRGSLAGQESSSNPVSPDRLVPATVGAHLAPAATGMAMLPLAAIVAAAITTSGVAAAESPDDDSRAGAAAAEAVPKLRPAPQPLKKSPRTAACAVLDEDVLDEDVLDEMVAAKVAELKRLGGASAPEIRVTAKADLVLKPLIAATGEIEEAREQLEIVKQRLLAAESRKIKAVKSMGLALANIKNKGETVDRVRARMDAEDEMREAEESIKKNQEQIARIEPQLREAYTVAAKARLSLAYARVDPENIKVVPQAADIGVSGVLNVPEVLHDPKYKHLDTVVVFNNMTLTARSKLKPHQHLIMLFTDTRKVYHQKEEERMHTNPRKIYYGHCKLGSADVRGYFTFDPEHNINMVAVVIEENGVLPRYYSSKYGRSYAPGTTETAFWGRELIGEAKLK